MLGDAKSEEAHDIMIHGQPEVATTVLDHPGRRAAMEHRIGTSNQNHGQPVVAIVVVVHTKQ